MSTWPRKMGIFPLACLVFFLCRRYMARAASVPYEVKIQMTGKAPPEVAKIMEEVSQTFQKKRDPPSSMALLKRRAEEDLPEMKKVLRSFGFFKNKISLKIFPPGKREAAAPDFQTNPEEAEAETHPPPGAATPVPANVLFQVDTGPRFSFGKASVSLTGEPPKNIPAPPSPI